MISYSVQRTKWHFYAKRKSSSFSCRKTLSAAPCTQRLKRQFFRALSDIEAGPAEPRIKQPALAVLLKHNGHLEALRMLNVPLGDEHWDYSESNLPG